MKEYYVKYWGQASDFLKKELGVEELDFWFNTKKERLNHVSHVKKICQNIGTIVAGFQEGKDVHLKTIAKMNLIYKGVKYPYSYDFGYGYPSYSAEFMFFEGNYSCDCNLSSFIQEINPDFPELDCGGEIEIEDFNIIKIGDNK